MYICLALKIIIGLAKNVLILEADPLAYLHSYFTFVANFAWRPSRSHGLRESGRDRERMWSGCPNLQTMFVRARARVSNCGQNLVATDPSRSQKKNPTYCKTQTIKLFAEHSKFATKTTRGSQSEPEIHDSRRRRDGNDLCPAQGASLSVTSKRKLSMFVGGTGSVGYNDTLGTREKCHSIQLSL